VNKKPYENQVKICPNEIEEMYMSNNHNKKSVTMLIGLSDKQKELWALNNIKAEIRPRTDQNRVHHDRRFVPQHFSGDVIMSEHKLGDSVYTRWKLKRSARKQLRSAKNDGRHIVWFCGGLTQKDRSFVLDQLSDYQKIAVVWEQDLDQLIKTGYERPTLDEGFTDFTYIVS
jgi:hypothetical protein